MGPKGRAQAVGFETFGFDFEFWKFVHTKQRLR